MGCAQVGTVTIALRQTEAQGSSGRQASTHRSAAIATTVTIAVISVGVSHGPVRNRLIRNQLMEVSRVIQLHSDICMAN